MRGLMVLSLMLLGSPLARAATTVACPLGAHHDHLTIHQVMADFGSYTLKAGSVALKYVSPNQVVTDADLTRAASDLQVAAACAEAVLADPAGDLLPDGASFTTGPQRDKLISDFISFMDEFDGELITFRQGFLDLLAARPEARNFKMVYDENAELNATASRAHKVISGDEATPAKP